MSNHVVFSIVAIEYP
jgi:MFS family permease